MALILRLNTQAMKFVQSMMFIAQFDRARVIIVFEACLLIGAKYRCEGKGGGEEGCVIQIFALDFL